MAWHPFRNLGLKAAALALGTLLWFTVTGEQVERKVPRVPIFYRNLPAALEITEQPDSVDVSVRGSYTDISRIQDMALTVDLATATHGANVVPLGVDMVAVPLGVQVTQIDPGAVTVWLERSESAAVPVAPTLEGQPAVGFAIKQVLVDPETVVVVGPESRLRPTTTAVTERVSVEGLSDTVIQVVDVAVADAQLRLKEPRTVRVTVHIVEMPTELTAEHRVVEWRGLEGPRDVEGAAPEVTVMVRASGQAAMRFTPDKITAYVDLAGRGPGRYNLPVRTEHDDAYEIISITPSTIPVRIR